MVDNPGTHIASPSWALLRAGGLSKRCGSKGTFSELRAGGLKRFQNAHSQSFGSAHM